MKFNKVLAVSFSILLFAGCGLFPIKRTPQVVAKPENDAKVAELGEACQTEFGEVPSGGSFTAYLVPFTAPGESCTHEVRVCNNGNLTGTYQFISCMEATAQFQDGTIPVVIPDLESENSQTSQ